MADDFLTPDDSTDFLVDFDGTVLDAYWSTPKEETNGEASYGDADKVRLYWHVRPDEVYQEYDGKVADTVTMSFKTGTGWSIQEDEDVVRHDNDDLDKMDPSSDEYDPDYKPRRFKSTCMWGQVLGLITDQQDEYKARKGVTIMDDGDEDITYDMGPARTFLAANDLMDPRIASIWAGTQWRFRGLGLDYGMEDAEVRARALPTAFLGVDPEAADAHGRSAPAGADDSAEAPQGLDAVAVMAAAPSNVTEEQAGALARLVDTSPSHTAFMRNAITLDWVKANDELKAWVMDADAGPYSLT